MSTSRPRPKAAPRRPPASVRRCPDCRKTRQLLQRREVAPPVVHEVLSSPGHPLDRETREFMEPRFGHDFSRVPMRPAAPQASSGLPVRPADDGFEREADRIVRGAQSGTPGRRCDFGRVRLHSDARAAESAKAVNALAYTVGRHIVFGAGQYSPGTAPGRMLLAHELTHVLQQAGTGPVLQRQTAGGEEPEKEEERSPVFNGCEEDRTKLIQDGIEQAKNLAAGAINAFNRQIRRPHESDAIKEHFGTLDSSKTQTVVDRYTHIYDTVESKTYTCKEKDKTSGKGDTKVGICGEAAIPGSTISLYPNFGTEVCSSAGAVILHEAAHNAGAKGDIDRGAANYPPKDAENNAYSYEYCALEIAAGIASPKLPEHIPRAPE
jgi:hypothetical protein